CGADRASGIAQPGELGAAAVRPPQPETTGEMFFFHPKNERFLAGKTKRIAATVNGWIIGVLLLVLVVGLFIFFGVGVVGLVNDIKLDQNGVETTGRVIDSEEREGDDSTSYYIEYEFRAVEKDRKVTAEKQVSWSNYSRWREKGSSVRVRYLPSNPSVNELVGDNTVDNNRTVGIIVGFIVLVVFGLITLAVFNSYLRSRELLRKGTLIKGEVLSCSSHEDSDDDLHITLRFRFFTPAGKEITKTESRMANEFKNTPLARPGNPVTILFLNEKRYRVL
ncbi:MAG: DUF3592 domain-containing protein, partial [Chloroflexi bacterium]|nr:DUF3592 domain-containing protein [Chloroflexota bacterium]